MRVFIAHSYRDREIVTKLTQALGEQGHHVVDPFVAEFGHDLLSEVSASIRSADAMVAILSNLNSSVIYELGLAAGAGVPTLVVAASDSIVPPGALAVPFVQLTEDVSRNTQTIVRRIGELKERTMSARPVYASASSALKDAVEHPALLEAMSHADFEQIVREFFEEQGYAVSSESLTHDTGVDFVVASPTDKRKILVQVKKLSAQGRVSVDTVRRLETAVSVFGAALGIVVASSGYTAAAAAMATGAPIILRTLKDLVASRSVQELLTSQPISGKEL